MIKSSFDRMERYRRKLKIQIHNTKTYRYPDVLPINTPDLNDTYFTPFNKLYFFQTHATLINKRYYFTNNKTIRLFVYIY